MADELQALLDKINAEGIKKAQAKADDIIAQAQLQAKKILDDAQQQADKTAAEAQQNAALLEQKGQESLRQAARDIMLALRQNLQDKVQKAVAELLRQQLDGTQLAGIIASVVTAYLQKGGETDDVTILLPAAQCTALQTAVMAKLGDYLKAHTSFAPTAALTSGFKLSFKGSDVIYDFSDQALADAISTFAGPKIAAVLAN